MYRSLAINLIGITSCAFMMAQDISKLPIEANSTLEIKCSTSGGMKSFNLCEDEITFIETLPKPYPLNKLPVVSASLHSFVEISKRTKISDADKLIVHNWLKGLQKLHIDIPSGPKNNTMGVVRYGSHLLIRSSSGDFVFDRDIIASNPDLEKHLQVLLQIGNRLTSTDVH